MSRGKGYSFTSNPVMKMDSDFNVSTYVLYIATIRYPLSSLVGRFP